MAKHIFRREDEERTELLGHDELFVQKGKGSDTYYNAWLHDSEIECCPRCGSDAVKTQDLFSKTYLDLVSDGQRKKVIQLEYEFYKYRCLDKDSIALEKDGTGQYETPTMKKGSAKQESKSQLEEVIEKFNEHYAGEITEGDRILAEILMSKMSKDDVLRKAAQQDGEQIFVNSVFSKAYDKTAMDAYKESSQAFSVLFSDPKKYAALKSVLAEIMYREFCQM